MERYWYFLCIRHNIENHNGSLIAEVTEDNSLDPKIPKRQIEDLFSYEGLLSIFHIFY